MKKVILLSIITLSLLSCKKNYDLTTIDNLKIGMSSYEFKNRVDSMNLIHKGFIVTSTTLMNPEDIKNNKVGLYYTDFFNMNILNDSHIQYPVIMQTETNYNDNITSMYFLLGHQTIITKVGSNSFETLSVKKEPGYTQVVSDVYLDYIYNKLEKMYGKPKDFIISNNQTTFYEINEAQIKNYVESDDAYGEKVIWETDSFIIEFFKGVKIYDVKYEPKGIGTYTFLFENNYVNDLDANCYRFGFINYRLKEDVIQRMKL